MTTVRQATHEDIPALVDLGEMFYNDTILARLMPCDRESIMATVTAHIQECNSVAFVLEEDGTVIGGLLGTLVHLYWQLSVHAAQQVAWFVHPKHRGISSFKLLAAFEKWAVDKGVRFIASGAKLNQSFECMDKMLSRKGYSLLEGMYIKGV